MPDYETQSDELEGFVVVVTGAASGIGAATVEALVIGGATPVLLDIDSAALDERVKSLEARVPDSAAVRLQVDVTNRAEVNDAFKQIDQAYGRVDGLVNAAGTARMVPFLELTEQDFDFLIEVNLKGTFLCGQEAARRMVVQKTGSIVNIASSQAHTMHLPHLAHYSASKAGVIGLTRAMAFELAKDGIRVNAVSPGGTDTPLANRIAGTRSGDRSSGALMDWAKASQIADGILFMLGRRSSQITGDTLHINGGRYMP